MIPGFTGQESLKPTTQNYRKTLLHTRPAAAGTSLVPQEAPVVQGPVGNTWGRYCGTDAVGPGPPIDDLDACCQAHDQCYGTRGGQCCSCDYDLLNCISNTSWGSEDKNRAYFEIYGAFKSKPCVYGC